MKPTAWVPAKLGDHFRIKHGYAFKGEYFSTDGDLIVLTPGNFSPDGGLKSQHEREKYYAGPIPEDFILSRGDFLVVMTDLTQNAPILASPALVPESQRFLHNQRLGKIVQLREEQLDKRFLYHLFNSKGVRDQIKATATGATVKHTAPERIYSVEVQLPPLPIQRKIAAVLSAYDALIENNRRRVAILEEMARSLYEEWFVRFRFPGHEEMVRDGALPEGWAVVRLKELADVNALNLKPRNAPQRIHYVDIASVSPGRIEEARSLPFGEAPGRARRVVRHGDVIWSNVRPNRRSHCLILNPLDNMIVSTGFTVLSATSVPYTYLYHAVTTDEFVGYLTNHATGAAYPAVTSSDFERAEVVRPSVEISARFHELAAPMLDLHHSLLTGNDILGRTRDLLLPKLISGELDVSDLNVETEELTA